MTGIEHDLVSTGDDRQHDRQLHHGKVDTYANPWAAAKRNTSTHRALILFLLWPKALGIEALRLLPETSMPVQRIPTEHHHGTLRNLYAPQLNVGCYVAILKPKGRMQSESFFDHHAGVDQLRQMLQR